MRRILEVEGKKKYFSAIIVLWIMLYSVPAWSNNFTDNFDDNFLNRNYWTPSINESGYGILPVLETNQQIEVTSLCWDVGSYVIFNIPIYGPFTAEVDYHSVYLPERDLITEFRNPPPNVYSVPILLNKLPSPTDAGQGFWWGSSISYDVISQQASTTYFSGKLRLTKEVNLDQYQRFLVDTYNAIVGLRSLGFVLKLGGIALDDITGNKAY